MALTQVTPDVVHNVQSNITQVGTLSNLTVTGNISSGNVIATNFTGTASLANNASFLGGTPAASYAIGSTITTANTNMKGYVDAANTIQSNQIGWANASISAANTAITTANTNMKGYVDGQISTTTTAITTANTNMKGYVDAANTIQSGQITTVSSSVTGANAAIVTANTNMKGYVDAANTIQSGQLTTVSSSVTGANAAITTANTNMKGYVDAVTTAWTANAAVQAGLIASKANTTTVNALVTAKGYISFESTTAAVYASSNLSVVRNSPGNFTITLAAGIQNGTVNYAPMVSAINKGQIVAMGYGPDALDVYGVGVTSISAGSFTVVATRNFDGGIGFYGGGNDGNNVHNFETAALETTAVTTRITIVVF